MTPAHGLVSLTLGTRSDLCIKAHTDLDEAEPWVHMHTQVPNFHDDIAAGISKSIFTSTGVNRPNTDATP